MKRIINVHSDEDNQRENQPEKNEEALIDCTEWNLARPITAQTTGVFLSFFF